MTSIAPNSKIAFKKAGAKHATADAFDSANPIEKHHFTGCCQTCLTKFGDGAFAKEALNAHFSGADFQPLPDIMQTDDDPAYHNRAESISRLICRMVLIRLVH